LNLSSNAKIKALPTAGDGTSLQDMSANFRDPKRRWA
jgi:hypothetical protein